jgi:hypothetical protein
VMTVSGVGSTDSMRSAFTMMGWPFRRVSWITNG